MTTALTHVPKSSNRFGRASVIVNALAAFSLLSTISISHASDIPVRGIVVPLKSAEISTAIAAQVLEINGKVGDSFLKDDVLASFDCGLMEAQKETMLVERKIAAATFENNQLMETRGAIAGHEVTVSRFELERANAAVNEISKRLDQCTIRAPFDGRFAEIDIHLLQTPTAGQRIMKIVSEEQFEVELIVPSQWLSWLKPGIGFAFDVDELEATLAGVTTRVGSEVDPVSQTVSLFGTFDKAQARLLAGMSGLAMIEKPGS